ncbi:BUD23 methyltransferase, partial [Polypterus senegalus]
MIEIQSQMSERAVELLSLPENQSCFLLDIGCGSGLSGDYLSEEGHYWVGLDISTAMLGMARGSRAVFQIYPENSDQLELITSQAMKAGFTGGMVVDYPNSAKAKKFFLCLFVGVSGALPKGLGSETVEKGVAHQAMFTGERTRFKNLKGKSLKKSKDWILEKKERRRRQGRSGLDLFISIFRGLLRVLVWSQALWHSILIHPAALAELARRPLACSSAQRLSGFGIKCCHFFRVAVL